MKKAKIRLQKKITTDHVYIKNNVVFYIPCSNGICEYFTMEIKVLYTVIAFVTMVSTFWNPNIAILTKFVFIVV